MIVASLIPRTDSSSLEAISQQYNALLPALVSQHASAGQKITFLDMHSKLTASDLSSDGQHPNQTGYNKMGDAWYAAMQSMLPGSPVSPPPPPTTAPTLVINDVTIAEGNSSTSTASFTVTRSGDLTSPTTVAYATADGTATVANSDYVAASGSLSFAAGVATKTINVTINGDTINEADETFTVNLSSPTNATFADAQGVGTITNDDAPPTSALPTRTESFGSSASSKFSVVGSPTTTGNNFGFSSTNNAGGSSTGEAGGTFARSASLDAYADTNLGGTLSRSQDLSTSGVVKITSNSSFDGDIFAAYFNTANRTGQALGLVIAEPGGTTPSGQFRAVAMIRTASGASVQSSAVGLAVGTRYAYSLTYTAATNTLSLTIAGSTVNVTGSASSDVFNAFGVGAGFASSDSSTQKANVYFDDLSYSAVTAGSSTSTPPTLAISDVSAAEGTGSTKQFSFIVTRSGDLTSPSTVAYSTADASATVADSDYMATSGTLSFAAGVATQTVNVTVNGDSKNEADEMFAVNLSSPTNATLADSQGIGTITNDDAPASGTLPTRTESFGSSASSKFVAVGSPTTTGNNFGFSNTKNAGGAATGEAGGTFARSASLDAYADTNLGGTVSRTQDLSSTGVVKITGNSSFDGEMFAAFFNTANRTGQALGLAIAEPGGTTPAGQFRAVAMIRSANGTMVQSTAIGLVVGTRYTYSLSYSAASQTLSLTIAGATVSVTGASSTDVYNAFGVGAGFASSDSSTQKATAYFDDLTYSAVTQ